MDGVYEFKDILAEFGKVYFLGFHPWNLHPAYFIYLAQDAGRRKAAASAPDNSYAQANSKLTLT